MHRTAKEEPATAPLLLFGGRECDGRICGFPTPGAKTSTRCLDPGGAPAPRWGTQRGWNTRRRSRTWLDLMAWLHPRAWRLRLFGCAAERACWRNSPCGFAQPGGDALIQGPQRERCGSHPGWPACWSDNLLCIGPE